MSLRARILLLVVSATLIPALVHVYLGWREREAQVADTRARLRASTQRIAEELEEAIWATAQLQYGLSRARELYVGDPKVCSDFLAGVLKDYSQYTGILTILPSGELFCDSLRTGRALNLTDRRYFQDALTSPAPVALEPVFGRLTGKAVLQVAYAAREAGTTRFVLLASLDLDRFMQSRFQGLPFKTAALALIDVRGTLLTWHPADEGRAGISLEGSALHRLARVPGGNAVRDDIEAGGVARVWAVSSPRAFPQAGLAVLLGISAAEITAAADRRLRQTLWIVGGAVLLAFALAWALAEAGIRRPIARMEDAAARLQAGDLAARIGAPYARGELGELMRALDSTAERLAAMNSELREQFESFMKNLPVMASIRDAQGRILYANDAWGEMNGVAPAQAVGRTNAQLFGTQFAAVVGAQDAEVLASGRPQRFRYTQPLGGEVRMRETWKFPLRRGGGEVTIGAITFDITEGERAAAALAASEERYRSLAENLNALVYRADPATLHATYVNRVVEDLYGYRADEWLADATLWERTLHPEDRTWVLAEFRQALKGRGEGRAEYRIVRRDGEVRWVADSFACERDASGGIVGLSGVVQDITERRLMFERLAESDRAKSAFLAAMSHELKTPLNVILGFSELLRDQSAAASTARAHAEEIRAAGARLLALLNDVLEFIRLEEGETVLRRESVDVALLLAEAGTAQKSEAERRGIALELDVAGAGSAAVDTRRLRQVVAQLLSNALKFTPEGGRVRLRAARSPDGRALEIAVEDSGIGIAPEDLAELFQPFVQLDSALSRKYGGTGLGLALARRIAELHGGTIEAQSEKGKGSIFTVRLRLEPAEGRT